MSTSFASRMTRTPAPYDIGRAEEVAACLPDLTGGLRDLVRGAGGTSPYLADLIRKHSEWLAEALAGTPETALSALMSEKIVKVAPDLRRMKARLSLLVALADLGGVWSLEEVTGALTDFADMAVGCALEAAVTREIRREKLPGQGEGDISAAGGLVVLAMGKMGAFELNYSSDIDLICLFDETRFEPDDFAEARTSFVRMVRAMTKTLSERTAEGYVFRTDLRLRPDASVTPVAMSMEAAEHYYESFGRTWERAAYIKARPCAGDIAAGQRFLDTLRPFVWRRHLDFAAIQDAHDMRLRIREHKGLHQAPSHLGHDLKLGRGGIREIEFFTQTRQIIAGGRDPELRASGTVAALGQLSGKGWVGEEEAAMLVADYRAHREAEHRVQMIDDQQTHHLPETEEDFTRLAALSGRAPAEYAREIEERLTRVARMTEGFFQPGSSAPKRPLTEEADALLSRWMGYPALRSRRASEILKRVFPRLQERLERTARPEESLLNFDEFLKGLPAGVQLFALFEANPQLLDLVVDIVDTAPALGQYLARNSQVFDAVIGGQFFSDWPVVEALTASLAAALAEESDYEKCLDRARVWTREWHFRVGVHHLRGLVSAEVAGQQYADLAGAVVAAIWPAVIGQFAEKHGAPPGRGAAVLAMGSLGAERLNAASDLDLIVIYDGAGEDASEGRRPLDTRTYYARLTQALVTALSAPTAEGRLYEVDMRLRPSGRQGPVATSLEGYQSYQANEAWTWEHLALTRARPLAGPPELCDQIEAVRRALLAAPRDRAKSVADVAEMRARLAEAKPASSSLDARAGPGRLQDIELFAEAGALLAGSPERRVSEQLAAAARVFDLSGVEREEAEAAIRLFWTLQAAARLVTGGGALAPEGLGTGAQAFLMRETGAADIEELAAKLEESGDRMAALIDRHIGSREASG